YTERKEQRADLHLQVTPEDPEQLVKAAAIPAPPDTAGKATAWNQDPRDLGEGKIQWGRVHQPEDAGGGLEQMGSHTQWLHRMPLEANIRVGSGRGGGHLDEAIADVHAEHKATLAGALGGQQRRGTRSGGNVDDTVAGAHSRALDAADRVFA